MVEEYKIDELRLAMEDSFILQSDKCKRGYGHISLSQNKCLQQPNSKAVFSQKEPVIFIEGMYKGCEGKVCRRHKKGNMVEVVLNESRERVCVTSQYLISNSKRSQRLRAQKKLHKERRFSDFVGTRFYGKFCGGKAKDSSTESNSDRDNRSDVKLFEEIGGKINSFSDSGSFVSLNCPSISINSCSSRSAFTRFQIGEFPTSVEYKNDGIQRTNELGSSSTRTLSPLSHSIVFNSGSSIGSNGTAATLPTYLFLPDNETNNQVANERLTTGSKSGEIPSLKESTECSEDAYGADEESSPVSSMMSHDSFCPSKINRTFSFGAPYMSMSEDSCSVSDENMNEYYFQAIKEESEQIAPSSKAVSLSPSPPPFPPPVMLLPSEKPQVTVPKPIYLSAVQVLSSRFYSESVQRPCGASWTLPRSSPSSSVQDADDSQSSVPSESSSSCKDDSSVHSPRAIAVPMIQLNVSGDVISTTHEDDADVRKSSDYCRPDASNPFFSLSSDGRNVTATYKPNNSEIATNIVTSKAA